MRKDPTPKKKVKSRSKQSLAKLDERPMEPIFKYPFPFTEPDSPKSKKKRTIKDVQNLIKKRGYE